MSNTSIPLFDDYSLDLARGCLTRARVPVHLRRQSYEVLKYLVENRGQLISKDRLIEEIWQGRAVTDGSLGKCIEEVRQALGEQARNYIRTERGRGYIFDASVHEPDARANNPTQTEQIEVLSSTVKDRPETEEWSSHNRFPKRHALGKFGTILAIAGASILIIAVIVTYKTFGNRNSASAPIRSIAVLPFKNESGNPEIEYLSDGMTESLINSVSRLTQLSVKARSTVFRYKDQQADPQRIASELSVEAIVEGRLVEHGDDLILYLSLIDGRNGNQLWGQEYRRKRKDLITLQTEIAREVTQKLRTPLSNSEEVKVAKNYTANADAYQLYLKGRYRVLKLTRSEVQAGIANYQQAIEIDPSYALAYVGLAEGYRVLTLNGEMAPTEFLPKAKAAAQRAIDIDESLAEAHAILGSIVFFYDHDWNEAERQFQRALELNPNVPDAHQFYANLFLVTGRSAAALAEAKRARELDPLNVRIGAIEVNHLLYAGQPDEALSKLQKVFEVDPNFWFAHNFASSAYIEKGMYTEAIAAARKAKQFSGFSTYPTAFLGYALAKSGKQTEARAELQSLLKLSKERYVSPYHISLICNGLGDSEATLAWLEKGYQQRDPRMVFLNVEPKFNNLREDLRFQSLLQRLNLQ